jgi:hypothetical protein
MFVPFENISPQARIWAYQIPRNLTEAETKTVSNILHDFVQNWQAHQQNLQASYQILHNRFIILAVDEHFEAASGCSIDKSVAVVRQISTLLNVDLFDRLSINYLNHSQNISDNLSNNTWETAKVASLKTKIEKQEFTANTIIFNSLVQTKQDLLTNGIVEASKTWVKKYF